MEYALDLSEQHPREQGLKLDQAEQSWPACPPFQSNIQENKDWNSSVTTIGIMVTALSEQHPREQGLKLRDAWDDDTITDEDFQSNIQENKDWNHVRGK